LTYILYKFDVKNATQARVTRRNHKESWFIA